MKIAFLKICVYFILSLVYPEVITFSASIFLHWSPISKHSLYFVAKPAIHAWTDHFGQFIFLLFINFEGYRNPYIIIIFIHCSMEDEFMCFESLVQSCFLYSWYNMLNKQCIMWPTSFEFSHDIWYVCWKHFPFYLEYIGMLSW